MEFQDVQPLVGQMFDVPSNEEGIVYTQLTLISVDRIPGGTEMRPEPFSLIFEGPSSNSLEQASFLLSNATLGEHPIFIVPLSDNGTVRQYQAIFS